MHRPTARLLTVALLSVSGFAVSGFILPGSAVAEPASEPSPTDDPASTDAPAAEPGAAPVPARRSSLSQELAEQGEAELQKSVRVFQQRFLLKAGRAELLLGGGSSLNDPLIHHFQTDASLLFHLNERWAVGVGAAKWFGTWTDSSRAVEDDYGLFAEQSAMQAGGFAEVQFSPVFGKFSSFGLAVLQADGYLLAGGGGVRTTRGDDIKPAGLLGFGLRIHALRWLTVSAEIRDILLVESFQGCPAGDTTGSPCGDKVLQHVFAGLRLGIWIPPTFQYRFPR